MKPLFWNVLIEIKKGERTSEGGIVLPDEVQSADYLLTSVGQVVSLGEMAFKTKTPGGHDYSVHAEDVKPGTWVLVSRKIGVPITMRDGRVFQMCNDYEVIAVLDEEEAKLVRGYV